MKLSQPKHCDDYIEDPLQPDCLRKFLEHARSPGHGYDLGPTPSLFATYKEPSGPGGCKGKIRRVKCVMASRMGDIGITSDLKADRGYQWRVDVADLKDFSDKE